MASILDRYGIKEVADVTFYKIDDATGNPTVPVLYLDTLKVSTIEQTAESTSARGGKGNPELIMWDYGKEITLTLEDALFSAKSMALMYGVDISNTKEFGTINSLLKTVKASEVKVSGTGSDLTYKFVINGKEVPATSVKFYDEAGSPVTVSSNNDTDKNNVPDNAVYATGNITITGQQVIISSDNFPGTYYITGDTYARSENSGRDEFFQFIVPKAKMQSEVTLTMEAEGDPSTFNMTMKVLRPASGEMMKLVKYDVVTSTTNG
jgi:hypothetical protein